MGNTLFGSPPWPDASSNPTPREKPIFISPKGWGHEEWIHNDELYCGKKLVVRAGKRCSLHYHKLKTETFYVASGKITLELYYPDGTENIRVMQTGDHALLVPGVVHRFIAHEDSEIIEFSTQHFEDDSYRIERGD